MDRTPEVGEDYYVYLFLFHFSVLIFRFRSLMQFYKDFQMEQVRQVTTGLLLSLCHLSCRRDHCLRL